MPICKIIRFDRYESVKLNFCPYVFADKLFVGWHQSTGYTQKKKKKTQDTIHTKQLRAKWNPKEQLDSEPGKCSVTFRRAHEA